jgi:hypothetical protein
MILLKCYNDGKGKYQSFEVWEDTYPLSEIDHGFGYDIDEATNNYFLNVDSKLELLQKFIENFKGNEDIVLVDCMGKPIND